jgi:CheY-like chemotaxis protein
MFDLNILIVDDDADDHLFLSSAIKEVFPGAKIKSFFDGVELAEYWFGDATPPDLIFLDLNMQIVDGKTALKNIRNDKLLQKVPVVILTTSASEKEKHELMQLGATEFYTKPHSLMSLVQIVQRVKNNCFMRAVNMN